MFSVITFGVLLNYIFHLDNFGMDPYGGYSIYMIDIFGSCEVTLLAYYLGVFLVLTIGMQAGYGIQRLVERVDLEGANSAAAEDEPNTDKDDNLSEK